VVNAAGGIVEPVGDEGDVFRRVSSWLRAGRAAGGTAVCTARRSAGSKARVVRAGDGRRAVAAAACRTDPAPHWCRRGGGWYGAGGGVGCGGCRGGGEDGCCRCQRWSGEGGVHGRCRPRRRPRCRGRVVRSHAGRCGEKNENESKQMKGRSAHELESPIPRVSLVCLPLINRLAPAVIPLSGAAQSVIVAMKVRIG
jgi:hypothetical protein